MVVHSCGFWFPPGDIFYVRGTTLVDVICHEYGHALANRYRGLIRIRKFTDVFGASYDSEDEFEYDLYFHVTEYAPSGEAERGKLRPHLHKRNH